MDIQKIQEKIRQELYVYSHHADFERQADQLTIAEIETALLNGEILEQYLDDVRGESCLIVGFTNETPIHIVCGWRGDKIVIITVDIPKPPKFIDPKTRGNRNE